ncbi:MAG: glycosyltransferase family 2 protein [bacterium]|nr:glycosyltransferase family 2 protein [bacterium]
MKLTVVIPVYNEERTLEEIFERVEKLDIDKEIILVDDGSTDGTREILKNIEKKESGADSKNDVKVIYLGKNVGKGAAVRAGIETADSDVLIIQDADLEYCPEEIPGLIKPIFEGQADVVYGSRFMGTNRVFKVWQYWGNKVLTLFSNLLYNTVLTDMETCYKVISTDLVKGFDLKSNGFEIEPELTAKILKAGARIHEMPITYRGRDFDEGKKITPFDGILALWAIIKYRFTN